MAKSVCSSKSYQQVTVIGVASRVAGKKGHSKGKKHIINSRRDVETGSIETGTPGRLQVLVRERGKVRLKHWYASSPVRDPPPSFNSRTELVIKLWN